MNIPKITEKWDGLLYSAMNVISYGIYVTKYTQLHQILCSNRKFKNIHKGQRCFVLLNGPSINNHDLSFLKNEIVFGSNYFFRAPICKIVEPNYYCWLDAKSFMKDTAEELLTELSTKCPQAELFINAKAYKRLGVRVGVNYVYAKHLPNVYSVKNNIAGFMSNFSTVAFLAISTAIYMGFSDIFVLGLDFEPGGFKHFADIGSRCAVPNEKTKKEDVCGLHWSYAKAQYESYALDRFAKTKGCKIINLNPASCVRAFEFGNYEELFNK